MNSPAKDGKHIAAAFAGAAAVWLMVCGLTDLVWHDNASASRVVMSWTVGVLYWGAAGVVYAVARLQ